MTTIIDSGAGWRRPRRAGGRAAGAPAARLRPRLGFLDHLFIIDALILRDLALKQQSNGVGYPLDLFRPVLIMTAHYYIFLLIQKELPANIPPESFVLAGFTALFGFIMTLSGTLSAAKWPGGAILVPGVSRMHLRVAKAAWAILSMLLLCLGGLVLLELFGDDLGMPDVSMVVLLFAVTGTMAFGVGLILEGIVRWAPALEVIPPVIMTLLFITSGMYFSLATIDPRVAQYFQYNPVLQIVEQMRHAFDPGYPVGYTWLPYPVSCAAGFLFAGLVVNRCLRRLDRE